MASSCKRTVPDEWEVSEIEASQRANVHGVMIEVSPVKKGERNTNVQYFDGKMSDGKECVRVVSFKPSLRGALENSCSKLSPISLVNCLVKSGRDGGMEVVATNRSRVEASPRKLEVSKEMMAVKCQMVDLCEVADLNVNDVVCVAVKVVRVLEPVTVHNREGKELKKQDCVVADGSKCIRVTVWEDDVGRLVEGDCYELRGLLVRCFDGKKFLSMGRSCEVMSLDDIGDVAEEESGDDGNCGVVGCVVEGEIDGVMSCKEYACCIQSWCKGKVESDDGVIGECGKCGMIVKMVKCEKFFMVKVVLGCKDKKSYVVTMFDDVISQVIDGISGASVEKKLLTAPEHRYSINSKDVVYAVEKLM